jgi:hypothetical protein
MAKWIVALGFIGVFGTGAAVAYIHRKTAHSQPGWCWFMGLAAIFPAWLITLVSLLGQIAGHGQEVPLPPSVVLSTSAALLGVIVTDFAVRRLKNLQSSFPAVTYWLLGLSAFLPAWGIAMWSFR